MVKILTTCFLGMLLFVHPGKSESIHIDEPFIQEFHVPYPIAEDGADAVQTIHIDCDENVWAGTKKGVYVLSENEVKWIKPGKVGLDGSVYDIISDQQERIWFGAWDGIYISEGLNLRKIENINAPIVALCPIEGHIIASGPEGTWLVTNDVAQKQKYYLSRNIRAALPHSRYGYWLATGMGLYHIFGDTYTLYQSSDEIITPDVRDVCYANDGSLWVGGLGGVSVIKNGVLVDQITPQNGLPSMWVNCIEQAPDGRLWVGTQQGITRYDRNRWSLRHSRRWLLHDDVRDVAFDNEGTAWIATAAGVSAIKQRKMTLADKADHFHRICEARHVREPGLVEKCRLNTPGDTTDWRPEDDDNDGQYTAMYLAMESYRYAVTQSPIARANAKRAFDALHFLQTVTETDGFVARTVIPVDWKHMHDPNRSYTPQQIADIHVHNPREKIVEQRWRPSSDGKWLWKGDTSSDEITGHMYGYLFYHDLVADAKEKERVRDHVCRIVDYIIAGGYVLKDIDGEHTKWGVWAPERLNNDPDWRQERGVNSVEILSYLKLAYHVSGRQVYQDEYEKLLFEHHYVENIKKAKTTNPAWRTHIDDELLALAFPCLLLHEHDPELRALYLSSLEQWYFEVSKDWSPYFNFIYAAFNGIDPNFDHSINFLHWTPLDLVRWRIDNTQREDVGLLRAPEMEMWQTDRMLPIDEISFFRWDKNQRQAVRGDGGHTESDGVFWLLPYWMGRYYDFIKSP